MGTRALDRALNTNETGDDVFIRTVDLLDIPGGSPGMTMVKDYDGQFIWGYPSVSGPDPGDDFRPLPEGGSQGQALTINQSGEPEWGATLDAGNY